MSPVNSRHPNWRDYQRGLQRWAKRRSIIRKGPMLCLCLMLVLLFYASSWIFAHLGPSDHHLLNSRKREDNSAERLTEQGLKALLSHLDLKANPTKANYQITREGKTLTVETSLDIALQSYILKLLERSRTHQSAVVVIRPSTGQVLAMANYEAGTPQGQENLCLKADYPAASLFKIVSAAAAIEARGFTPERPTVFRGLANTLYRYQLRKDKGRYTRVTTFKKAFAKSINPVFGRIGIYDLGRDLMTEYAKRFLFNQAIPFDLPLATSQIEIPEDDYGLAEIASGFNRKTLISPLHSALITAAIANDGVMIKPWMVWTVKDDTGKMLYHATRSILATPIHEDTANRLRILMQDTVLDGTLRRAFRPLRHKKLFKDIEVGAKTGTINDRQDQYKYDWTTAYALSDTEEDDICVTVLAIHGELLGTRARDLARSIINHFFSSGERSRLVWVPDNNL